MSGLASLPTPPAAASLPGMHADLAACGGCSVRERHQLHTRLGDAYSALRDHNSAVAQHTAAHRLLLEEEGTVGERVASLAAVATSLSHDNRHTEALDVLTNAVEGPPKRGEKVKVPRAALRTVLMLQSTILACKGDSVSALATLEAGVSLPKDGTGPGTNRRRRLHDAGADKVRHLALRFELMQRVLAEGGMPPNVEEPLRSQRDHVLRELRAHYPDPEWQLPQTFVPGLKARPWHEPSEWAPLARTAEALRAAQPALRREWYRIREAGLPKRDHECIHDPNGGEWLRYEPTAPWRPLDRETGCSVETPSACELYAKLRASGVPVLRLGYSAIGPGGTLRPHFGRTNAQTKLHLGLVVPHGPCATLRVGNETRSWAEGGVLSFDDSFLHEARNRCETERVVFQLVVVARGVEGGWPADYGTWGGGAAASPDSGASRSEL